MKQGIRPCTQHMSWRLPEPASSLHISYNITAPLLEGVTTDQLDQP